MKFHWHRQDLEGDVLGSMYHVMCPSALRACVRAWRAGWKVKCRRDEVHVWSKKEGRNSKGTKGGMRGSHISQGCAHIMECLA